MSEFNRSNGIKAFVVACDIFIFCNCSLHSQCYLLLCFAVAAIYFEVFNTSYFIRTRMYDDVFNTSCLFDLAFISFGWRTILRTLILLQSYLQHTNGDDSNLSLLFDRRSITKYRLLNSTTLFSRHEIENHQAYYTLFWENYSEKKKNIKIQPW